MGVGRGRTILAALVLGLVALPVPALLTATRATAAAPKVKILPLGDSITLGAHDGYSSPGGYRIALEDKLVAGGYSFDFVGTQPPSGPSSLADKNHEGHGGFTINGIRGPIDSYLAQTSPDLVLLMIGANDVGLGWSRTGPSNYPYPLSEAPTRLSGLIDRILQQSSARVIVAKVTPWKNVKRDRNGGKCDPGESGCIQDYFKPWHDATAVYNSAIPGIVAARSARVSMVDMFTNFRRDNNSGRWMDDEQHPNLTGYNQVAGRWYPELERVLDSMPNASAPGAPTGVSATPGNGEATVSFLPPTSDGGAPITGYSVIRSPGGQVTLGPSSPIRVTGLTNGTPYTFTVKASNSAGQGPASSPSSPVTPTGAAPTAPGAPTIGTAVAGDKQATVSFSPPASNGGSPITSYTVTRTPSGPTMSGPSSPIMVAGLTNGTAYTFTVTATNSAGTGPPSSQSNSVTPAAGSATGTQLSSLTATKTGTGSFRLDRNGNNSGSIKLGSQTYPTGLGVNPPVTLTYALGDTYQRFQSDIGVDEICGNAGSVRFKVFLDGAPTSSYDSGAMTGATATKQIDLDVADATSLQLVYERTGAVSCDYGAWANARLTT